MAARTKTTSKKVTRKKTAPKKAVRKKSVRQKSTRKTTSPRMRASAALDRLERELPSTLRDFSRSARSQLSKLEQQIDRAQTRYRRQAVRLLREGSHRLGSLEAQGERGWRELNERARNELLNIVRRIERALETAGAQKATAPKKAASKSKRKVRATPRKLAPASEPPEDDEIPDIFQTPTSAGG